MKLTFSPAMKDSEVETYWYVATPYSNYIGGLDAAFLAACRVTAALIKAGIRVYCPIAHTHPVAIHGGLDPLDHAIWMPADRPLMEAASGLIVVKMQGWGESRGVQEEIKVFKNAGKPIHYLEWPE